MRSVLSQYESVLTATEEMSQSTTMEMSAGASGLHKSFLRGNAILGIILAEDVMAVMEELNISLQQRSQTTSGMLAAVDHVKRGIQAKRSEVHFDWLYSKASQIVTSLNLQPIKMPHVRKPPKRFTGPATSHSHSTAQAYYRMQYYNTLDTAVVQCNERFSQDGLQRLQKLEDVLISGNIDAVVDEYPELDAMALEVQLKMFQANYTLYGDVPLSSSIDIQRDRHSPDAFFRESSMQNHDCCCTCYVGQCCEYWRMKSRGRTRMRAAASPIRPVRGWRSCRGIA
ncbi:unnamed protein product [Arctogadus glacialis]